MIRILKRANKHLMYVLVGLAATFCMLGDLLSVSAASVYTLGNTSYTTFSVLVVLFSVAMFALVARLLVYVAFRIGGAIFTRKSGMLYPFPIGYREFESTVLALSFPCFLLAGIMALPSLFFPTFSGVTSAIRTFVTRLFLAFGVAYFVKNNGHDYDRRSLAVSLSVVPLVLIGLSLILAAAEVLR